MVNLLLRRMIRKGLVKLERINGRTLRYKEGRLEFMRSGPKMRVWVEGNTVVWPC